MHRSILLLPILGLLQQIMVLLGHQYLLVILPYSTNACHQLHVEYCTYLHVHGVADEIHTVLCFLVYVIEKLTNDFSTCSYNNTIFRHLKIISLLVKYCSLSVVQHVVTSLEY